MAIFKDNPLATMLGMLALALTLTTPTSADATHSNNNGNGGGQGVPELDPGAAASAITLLVGGLAIALERRRRFGADAGLNDEDSIES